MSSKNILVTGGAGFVGSHLVDALLRMGHRISVVDDLSLGRKENISHISDTKNFRFEQFSLLEKDKLSRLFEEEHFDVVFHMAANSDILAGVTDPTVDLNRTFLTTFSVLECMRKYKVSEIIFASSSAIYGDLSQKLHEDSGPLFPASFYGAAKLASEGALSVFSNNYGIQAWIVRFPNVVGERTTHGVVFDFIKKLRQNPKELEILGDGKQEKPYLYVRDLIKGILFIWENAREKFNYFNLSVPSRTTVTKLAHIVAEEMGLNNVTFRYTGGARGWSGDVPSYEYDLSKIHTLGWKARLSSDDAIRKAVQLELRR